MTTEPRFPVYVVSKGRADTATTPTALDRMGVDRWIVVEDAQHDAYAARYGPERLLVLPESYKTDYDLCGDFEDGLTGPGPARNFAWEHSIESGAAWHWVLDDNIQLFARWHQNKRIPVGDGSCFHAMETFSLRYSNVAIAGPHYWMFAPSRGKRPPFVVGTRVYSCLLIRNDLPFRWRARYNEDTDICLRALKLGWNTVLFNAFLQFKTTTQQMGGGNTEEFYAEEGTLPKSQMLVDLHPDVSKLVRRWGRWHHFVDYSQWRDRPLIRRDDYDPADDPTYSYTLRPRTR